MTFRKGYLQQEEIIDMELKVDMVVDMEEIMAEDMVEDMDMAEVKGMEDHQDMKMKITKTLWRGNKKTNSEIFSLILALMPIRNCHNFSL